MLALSALARASTIDLRWNDCPAGPTASQVLTFPCDDDASTFRLVGTVTPDDQITQLTALEVTVDLLAASDGPLPDWWQMQAGGCRGPSLSVSPRVTEVGTCPNLWPPSVAGGFQYEYPFTGESPNAARVTMVYAVPLSDIVHPVPGTEYDAFELLIDARHTTPTDAPACGGCDEHVCIAFWRANLLQRPGIGDHEVRSATAVVSWRCPTIANVDIGTTIHSMIGGGLSTCALGQCPTPALRPTWGRLKALYR